MSKLLAFARKHILLFGAGKFLAGLVIGFGLGVYFLPILTAEKGLSKSELSSLQARELNDLRQGVFMRDLPASDRFHWGEGTIYVANDRIWLDGKIAPGPDYRLYLTKGQVTDKADFLSRKADSLQVSPIKAYENFSIDLPENLDISAYDSVLIWCEAFSVFITAATIR